MSTVSVLKDPSGDDEMEQTCFQLVSMTEGANCYNFTTTYDKNTDQKMPLSHCVVMIFGRDSGSLSYLVYIFFPKKPNNNQDCSISVNANHHVSTLIPSSQPGMNLQLLRFTYILLLWAYGLWMDYVNLCRHHEIASTTTILPPYKINDKHLQTYHHAPH